MKSSADHDSLLLDVCYPTPPDNRGQVRIPVLDLTTITPNVEDVNGHPVIFTSTQVSGVVYDYRDSVIFGTHEARNDRRD